MPIKGLTTQGGGEFFEIGRLRKGGPKKRVQKKGRDRQPMFDSEGKPVMVEIQGDNLDHFRFVTKDRRAADLFERLYGRTPREVKIWLIDDEPERAFFTCKEKWAAAGLEHRCDGEFCSVIRLSSGQLQRQFAAPVACPGGCKEVGRLRVIIRGLNRFAYVTVETHSKWDIVNIDGQVKAAAATFGRLKGVPFVLRRSEQEISKPGSDGKRFRATEWLMSLEVDPEWAESRFAQMDAIAYQGQFAEARAGAIAELPPAPAPTLPGSYFESKAWRSLQEFLRLAQHHADPADAVERTRQWAYEKIEAGELPGRARGAIDQACDRAQDMIRVRGGAPLPKPEPEPEPIDV